jgi:hypothetical protein
MGSSGTIGVPIQEPLCVPSSDDERISAIYLDLDLALPAGPRSRIEQSAPRIRKQQWFDVSSNQSDVVCPLDPAESTLILESLFEVGCAIVLPPVDPRLDAAVSPSADTGFSLELISLDPTALALILEFPSGESWEIGLATLDGGPFERTAFASDGAGFFINLIEWGEDGELVVLDADFEVEFAGGNRVAGRILWNAPWTPDEEPFVPLSDDDRANAWPGEVSMEGPALRLLAETGWVEEWLDSTPTGRLAQICSVGSRASKSSFESTDGFWVSRKPGTQPVDSIRYSRELAIDPNEARKAVAREVDSLSEESQSGAAAHTAQTIEDPTSIVPEVMSSTWSNPLISGISPPADAGFSLDLISRHPSKLTVILEFASGEIREIGLSTLDGGPLEPAAFESDGARFLIQSIDWDEDGELVALDADFEVELADGDLVEGRIAWDAPRTRGEEPVVALTDGDWANAWPGAASIERPDPRLLAYTGWAEESLDATLTAGLSQGSLVGTQAAPFIAGSESESSASEKGDDERLKSIDYSREPTIDPEAAQEEVAADVESLDTEEEDIPQGRSVNYSPEPAIDTEAAQEEVAPDVESLDTEERDTTQGRSTNYSPEPAIDPEAAREEVAADVDALAQESPSSDAERESQEIEEPASNWFWVTPFAWSTPPTPPEAPPDSENSRDQQTREIASNIRPAGLEDSEPMEADFEQRAIDWAALARSVAVAWNPNPEVSPDDSTGIGPASETRPALALFVRDASHAVEHERPAGNASSLGNRIEAWWRAVHAIAGHWWRAIIAFMLETQP